ncbi:MAG: hypothetical protein M1157_01575 [Deinococcus sp.]|nr:hypothetical protein [Deinococcus sp.]
MATRSWAPWILSSLILRAKAIRQRIAAFREGVVPGQHLQEAGKRLRNT